MATPKYIRLEGIETLQKTFRDIPKQINIAGIRGAARKASKPLIANARSKINRNLVDKSAGNFEKETDDSSKFSKAKMVIRHLKATNKKPSAYAPGVRILVKGPDIPMNGGKEFWNIQGYLKLMAAGSYKVGKRSTSSGANRGKFKGFGNFLRDAYEDTQFLVDAIFSKNLTNEVNKAIIRAKKRNAKKLLK
jgi:hypothetical protein|tara:strand:- start:25049 stop:25624 length:576 start_codon:yes stop_codon:yes gene_type:complete